MSKTQKKVVKKVVKQKSNEDIVYCKNSTLFETWVSVLGEPRVFSETDGTLISGLAEKDFKTRDKDLQKVDTISVFPKTDKPLDAFWYIQRKWDKDLFLSRFGHNFLSVHRLSNPSDKSLKYSSFDESLLPDFERWHSYSINGPSHEGKIELKSISLGYLNHFKLPLKDFSLDQHFNVDVKAKIETSAAGLSDLRLAFSFVEDNVTIRLTLTLNNSVVTSEGSYVPVAIETNLTNNVKDMQFYEIEKIKTQLEVLRLKARRVFFSFCTPKTISSMGPVYKKGRK